MAAEPVKARRANQGFSLLTFLLERLCGLCLGYFREGYPIELLDICHFSESNSFTRIWVKLRFFIILIANKLF